MKKRAFFLGILSLLMVVSSRGHAVAAACTNADKYGSVSLAVPVLPSRGDYTIWTRMQVPDDNHNQYSLEINNNTCYQVGGASLSAGQWTWVGFEGGDLSKKTTYNFDHTTDNVVKLIGSQAGVKIDSLLFIKGACVPSDLGENCQTNVVRVNTGDTTGATEVPPLSSGTVSGIVIPSHTITQSALSIVNVTYAANGQSIPSTESGAIDTTLLPNGKNRLLIQISLSNGTVVNEVTTLDVSNPQTPFSPLVRWARLNKRTAWLFGGIAAGALVIAVTLLIIRRVQLRKRLLHFKGF